MSEEVKAISECRFLSKVSCTRRAPQRTGRQKGEQRFPFFGRGRDVYEGPLDLLLDLIRKQDIDIYDIPSPNHRAISDLCREAARAGCERRRRIHLHGRGADPHQVEDAAAARSCGARRMQEDPRTELVNRLIEHEKFKSAAQMLMQKQQIEDAVWSNPAMKEFMDAEGTEPELAADVIDLVKTFQQILDRARSRPMMQVDEETVTVGQMIEYLRRRLSLEDARSPETNAAQRGLAAGAGLHVPGDAGTGAAAGDPAAPGPPVRRNLVRKHVGFEAVMDEQAAVRDDWK